MEAVLLSVHVLVSLALVGIILIQQGKGADAGASFGGGSSQTVFGAAGSANFLTRTTRWLAIVFFFTTLTLAYLASKQVEAQNSALVPEAPAGQVVNVEDIPIGAPPANPDIPVGPASAGE